MPCSIKKSAGVVELADTSDLSSDARRGVWVQVPPPAPNMERLDGSFLQCIGRRTLTATLQEELWKNLACGSIPQIPKAVIFSKSG